MTRITDLRGDFKGQRSRSPGRSGWLFELPPGGGRDIIVVAALQAAHLFLATVIRSTAEHDVSCRK